MAETHKRKRLLVLTIVFTFAILTIGLPTLWAKYTENLPAETKCFNEYHCKVTLGSWLKPVEYEYYESADNRKIEQVFMFEGEYRIEGNAVEKYTSTGREPVSGLPSDAFRWLIIGREALNEYREKTNATQKRVASFFIFKLFNLNLEFIFNLNNSFA